jgi:hypothetical protein
MNQAFPKSGIKRRCLQGIGRSVCFMEGEQNFDRLPKKLLNGIS